MDAQTCWVSHPAEWQPLVRLWAAEYREQVTLHEWPQYGGESVLALTVGSTERPVRLLVAVPHAHEPAPTAAIMDFACQLLTGGHRDGSSPPWGPAELLERCLTTLIPDSNCQGRARSPRRVWDGVLDNETFLKVAFGEAADGERFGRYPEWRFGEHQPREIGIVYEQVEPDLWVEPNTSRRSSHTRAIDVLFGEYGYTHYLDMHQHEGDETALLPAEFDDLPQEAQGRVTAWAEAVLGAWEDAGIHHKGSYVPYRGQPRQQFFREYWSGRCPGMLKLTTETRNNRHIPSDEPTSLERQFRSASRALAATVEHLLR